MWPHCEVEKKSFSDLYPSKPISTVLTWGLYLNRRGKVCVTNQFWSIYGLTHHWSIIVCLGLSDKLLELCNLFLGDKFPFCLSAHRIQVYSSTSMLLLGQFQLLVVNCFTRLVVKLSQVSHFCLKTAYEVLDINILSKKVYFIASPFSSSPSAIHAPFYNPQPHSTSIPHQTRLLNTIAAARMFALPLLQLYRC